MRFEQLVGAAFSGQGVEVSLEQLCDALGAGTVLECVEAASKRLEAFGLELIPGWNHGDMKTVRILRPIAKEAMTADRVGREIEAGETLNCEFKASLLFDRQRAKYDVDAKKIDLCSDAVLMSTLKAIAAFVNSGGGVLLLGVNDDGAVVGIEDDLPYCRGTVDGWELHLRNCIDGRFKNGAVINDYIRVGFCQMEAMTVSRLEVIAREELCYLKMDKRYRVFRRQGNRSVEVTIDQLLVYDRERRSEKSA